MTTFTIMITCNTIHMLFTRRCFWRVRIARSLVIARRKTFGHTKVRMGHGSGLATHGNTGLSCSARDRDEGAERTRTIAEKK